MDHPFAANDNGRSIPQHFHISYPGVAMMQQYQLELGGFTRRADFAFVKESPYRLLAVEVDGWAHHRDRWELDRQYDRDVQLIEGNVLRFPAKAVFRAGYSCIKQVHELLAKWGKAA